jgi:class I fructose-bisphosphate aldolase
VRARYAHKIPFLVKFNHNEFLTYPNKFDQIFFARVSRRATWARWRSGATIYFGSPESRGRSSRSARRSSTPTRWARHRAVVLPAQPAPSRQDKDYHLSADLTGQANHLGVTLEADIIKQKLPENNGGYNAISSKENPYGKIDKRVYEKLTHDHPVDLTRYQVANCFMGRSGLINSGGASGENDFARPSKTAVINSARAAWADQRPEGVPASDGRGREAPQPIQDVYLCKDVTIA